VSRTDAKQPNVVLILTDDQGYPDLGSSGNPWIQTPHLDRLKDESVFCNDFHVQPLCTPTRGALMSGHRPVRNGAWATCWGRSILKREETIMPEIFRDSGYRTGMFGKWHLGDNYPYRPEDRGFEHVVAHKGGGVGQTPDFWGNNYFDDTYFHNGEPVQHEGYCTDIWFDQAMRWIDGLDDGERFFCYIATNAPHSPYLVEERYAAPYRETPEICEPAFYGMITNIDENVGKLRTWLAEKGLAEDTVFVFFTDNGSSGSARLDERGFPVGGYNAGLRGKKGSFHDGGHKAPLFVHWPGGNLVGGRAVQEMTLDVDLLPTFIDLCGLSDPGGLDFDGTSFAPLLRGEAQGLPGDRVHFLQNRQGTEVPPKWTGAALTRQWRLIGGEELYDIRVDPGQTTDVSAEHPEIVRWLRDEWEAWYEEIEPQIHDYCPIVLGSDHENPMRLDAMDVMGDVAWHQTHICQAQQASGRWTVEVERAGRYRFRLRRWPEELNLAIDDAVSPEEAERHIYAPTPGVCNTIEPTRARLGLFGREWTVPVEPGQAEAVFEIDLAPDGKTTLDAWFGDGETDTCGAYYVCVERLDG